VARERRSGRSDPMCACYRFKIAAEIERERERERERETSTSEKDPNLNGSPRAPRFGTRTATPANRQTEHAPAVLTAQLRGRSLRRGRREGKGKGEEKKSVAPAIAKASRPRDFHATIDLARANFRPRRPPSRRPCRGNSREVDCESVLASHVLQP